MIRVTRLTCLIALPLALSACGSKEPDANAMAAGEILEGTASDAMLPLDTVRSQPPLAPQTEAAKANGKKDEAEAEDDTAEGATTPTDTAATPAAAPTIAVPPAPTPSPTRPAMK